jgi:hypothetical protein
VVPVATAVGGTSAGAGGGSGRRWSPPTVVGGRGSCDLPETVFSSEAGTDSRTHQALVLRNSAGTSTQR